MEMIGQLLDRRYRIVQVLSSGAFGQTYLSADTRRPGHPQCVVKQLRPPNNNSNTLKTALLLFRQEAEILERLDFLKKTLEAAGIKPTASGS